MPIDQPPHEEDDSDLFSQPTPEPEKLDQIPEFDQLLAGPSISASEPEDRTPSSVKSDQDGLTDKEKSRVAERLEKLPKFTPRSIEEELLKHGYRGQKFARRAGSVLAYRHLQRLRREFMDGDAVLDLPPRESYLFLGATGSGKTYLIELLFRTILGVPTVISDMTRFSEAGYVGDDVQMILSQLYEGAEQDRGWASCGVACLDEFDKLAASRSSARFAGEGTTKDVSGFGVQRGLLTLLSGQVSPFPTDFGFSGHGQRMMMPLHNLMFVACGAFSGLRETAELGKGEKSIGFANLSKNPATADTDDALVSRISAQLLENTRAFADYGILPELVGRFSRLVPFQPLAEEVLREILNDTLIHKYRAEFDREGVSLEITDSAIAHIIETAHRRETGARALRASLVPYLEEAAFDTFGKEKDEKAAAKIDFDGSEIQLIIS